MDIGYVFENSIRDKIFELQNTREATCAILMAFGLPT